jgi:hypothetical protein
MSTIDYSNPGSPWPRFGWGGDDGTSYKYIGQTFTADADHSQLASISFAADWIAGSSFVDFQVVLVENDPPPLKWSDLRYVFDIQEDCNGKEAIQA